MKYLILFIMISSYCFGNDKIDRFEDTYIKKAELLKATRDKSVKEADEKFVSDSRKLAEAYIKVLKKEQIAIVKTGDLEAALKIKAKIIEIENVLNGQVIINPVKITRVIRNTPIGQWIHYKSKAIYTFDKSGALISSQNYKGVWKMIGVSSFTTKWSHQKFTETHYIVSKGQQLQTKNYIWATRIASKSIISKWQQQHKNRKIFTLYNDGTITISPKYFAGDNNGKYKWKIVDDKMVFDWLNGNIDTFTISGNLLIDGKSKKGHRIYNYKKLE